MTLLVCTTCPRDDRRNSGRFARELLAALDPAVAVRRVQCLGGCPDDAVVAVDGPGTARVRFTGLSSDDAAAITAAAQAYAASATGLPDDWDVPAALGPHLSSVTPKRPRRA